MSGAPTPILPRWLRAGMLAALVGALLYALLAPPSDALEGLERGEALASREVRFLDGRDGAVTVHDAATGETIARLPAGEDGFLRSVMRGLARERRARGHGAEAPFRLTAWTGGFLSLEDPATGRLVELTAFGPDNVRAFSRLVDGSV